MEKNSGSSLIWDMAVHPSEILVEQRCVNSNMFWLWSEKRNSHSVCLSNFCRNSIAVARWGGLINCWGKCDERDCRYGIQEHSKCALAKGLPGMAFFAGFFHRDTHAATVRVATFNCIQSFFPLRSCSHFLLQKMIFVRIFRRPRGDGWLFLF